MSDKNEFLEKWHKQNRKNYLHATRNKIIALFASLFLPILLFLVFSQILSKFFSGTSFDLFFISSMTFASVGFLTYFYKNLIQLSSENELLNSLKSVRKKIRGVTALNNSISYSSFQMSLNRSRRALKDFIEVSAVLSPPIANYELDRVQKSIDVFFNTTSEVLFPINRVYSRAQRIELDRTIDYYGQTAKPTEDEIKEHFEEEERQYEGTISTFDILALDEFFNYLGKIIFSEKDPYSLFPFKHPINLIEISQFFKSWNNILKNCTNCTKTYLKAEKDIQRYYSDIQARQLVTKERYNEIIIVIISVSLSTVVNVLLKLANVG